MKRSKDALLFVLLFGMEVCWLYAIFNAGNKAVEDRLSIPWLLTLLIISWVISALLKRLRWPRVLVSTLAWVLWPPAMLLMLKLQLFGSTGFADVAWLGSLGQAFSHLLQSFEAPLLVFLASVVLWWLGRRLAYLKLDFSSALTETQLGVVALVVVFFSAYQLQLDQSSSVNLSLFFFFAALLGLSLSHAAEGSWFFSARRNDWMAVILVCVAVVLLVGRALSLIFSPDLIQVVIKAAKWIWSQIDRFIAFILSLFPASQPDTSPSLPVPGASPPPLDEGSGLHLPDWLKPGLTLGWELLAGGLLLVAVWRITAQIFGWMRRQIPAGADQVESLRGAFKTDLLNFLRRIVSAVFRVRFGPGSSSSRASPTRIQAVRQIYGEFLRRAAADGHPRAPSQTPQEFSRALSSLLAEERPELDLIAREYMSARYGAREPAEENLGRLKGIWRELKKSGFKSWGKQDGRSQDKEQKH